MARNHESILWVVERTNVVTGVTTKRYVFRTRKAAIEFKVEKHNAERNPDVKWYRKRAEWGPNG